MESAALTREIEQLEQELSNLRTRADEDNSSFSALEEQIGQLRERLSATRDTLRMREEELSEKRAQLEEAHRVERLADYEDDLEKFKESRGRVASSAETLLSELDSYDGEVLRMRKLLEEMRSAFGADDDGVNEVAGALAEESEELGGTWRALVDATQWRLEQKPAVAPVPDAPAKQEAEKPDLSEDLQNRAEEGRAARILEYFNKS